MATRKTRSLRKTKTDRRKSHYDTSKRSRCFAEMFFDPLPPKTNNRNGTIFVRFQKTPGRWYWYRINWMDWLSWRHSGSLGKYYNRNIKLS